MKKGDKVLCKHKHNYGSFKKGEHYKVKGIHSIFSENTIQLFLLIEEKNLKI